MRKKKLKVVDLFCGAGGTSTGMMQAAQTLGVDPESIDLTAVNHWRTALDTHGANHPHARHLCERLEKLQPERVVPGGRADLLWASPECIHHSRARGGKPKNDQSRCQAWTVLDWVQRLQPKGVIIENVPEFAEWGPLYASGKKKDKPIPQRRGEIFRAWVAALEAHGYRTGWRFLNCADYGDATTRQRFFLMARRGNRFPIWPEATHSKAGGGHLFGNTSPWVPARDIIDWSNPGHSIFLSREDVKAAKLKAQRPLVPNTMRRIEAGIKKFWGEWAEPFLICLRGTRERQLDGSCIKLDKPLPAITAGGGHVGLVRPILCTLNNWPSQIAGRSTDGPLPAQTTANHFGLIQPFFFGQQSGSVARSSDDPCMTISTGGRIQLCQPFLATLNHGTPDGNYGRRTASIENPFQTITTSHGTGVVRPFIVKYFGTGTAIDIESPLDTVTTDDRFGLVRPILVEAGGERYLFDILFRMLTPAELAAAHSFPASYQWCGNKTDIVKQIGNSVPVLTAMNLCLPQLATYYGVPLAA